jgi:hypothetical protein
MNGTPSTGTKGTIFIPTGEGATRIQSKQFQSSKYVSTELGSTTEKQGGGNTSPGSGWHVPRRRISIARRLWRVRFPLGPQKNNNPLPCGVIGNTSHFD